MTMSRGRWWQTSWDEWRYNHAAIPLRTGAKTLTPFLEARRRGEDMRRESEQGGCADREGAAGVMDRGISVFHGVILAGNMAGVSRFLERREQAVLPEQVSH